MVKKENTRRLVTFFIFSICEPTWFVFSASVFVLEFLLAFPLMEDARIVFSPKRSDMLFAVIGIDCFAFFHEMSVVILVFLQFLYLGDKAIDVMRLRVMLEEDARVKVQVTEQ